MQVTAGASETVSSRRYRPIRTMRTREQQQPPPPPTQTQEPAPGHAYPSAFDRHGITCAGSGDRDDHRGDPVTFGRCGRTGIDKSGLQWWTSAWTWSRLAGFAKTQLPVGDSTCCSTRSATPYRQWQPVPSDDDAPTRVLTRRRSLVGTDTCRERPRAIARRGHSG